MEDQRDTFDCLGAIGCGAQISVAEFDFRLGMGVHEWQDAFRFGGIAKEAANIGVPMSKEAFDDMESEETSRASNQDFHSLTSG
jgi:hypothetical protein